jgi:hypothetical protein
MDSMVLKVDITSWEMEWQNTTLPPSQGSSRCYNDEKETMIQLSLRSNNDPNEEKLPSTKGGSPRYIWSKYQHYYWIDLA